MQSQREFYFREGYLLVKRIVGDEWLSRLRAATEEMVEEVKWHYDISFWPHTNYSAFPRTVNPIRLKHDQTIIRGERAAAWAHHDPRPCLLPPDWSGGYTSIFALQQQEEAKVSGGM